jgi:hypothetical protein
MAGRKRSVQLENIRALSGTRLIVIELASLLMAHLSMFSVISKL